jgi:hypothetical protein
MLAPSARPKIARGESRSINTASSPLCQTARASRANTLFNVQEKDLKPISTLSFVKFIEILAVRKWGTKCREAKTAMNVMATAAIVYLKSSGFTTRF